MYNAESTNKVTPKACNDVKSNDLDANRLLFEHVKMQKKLTCFALIIHVHTNYLYIKMMTRLQEVMCSNQTALINILEM